MVMIIRQPFAFTRCPLTERALAILIRIQQIVKISRHAVRFCYVGSVSIIFLSLLLGPPTGCTPRARMRSWALLVSDIVASFFAYLNFEGHPGVPFPECRRHVAV